MEEKISVVKNYNIAVRKHGEEITFLRRIIPGGADDSYGIEVARLAGVPDKVVRRARQILRQQESEGPVQVVTQKEKEPDKDESEQIVDRLKKVDVNALTPIECMNLLYELSRLAR